MNQPHNEAGVPNLRMELFWYYIVVGPDPVELPLQADSPFQYGGPGFVVATVHEASMRLEFIGIDSEQPLFVVDIAQEGPSSGGGSSGGGGAGRL